MPAAATAKYSVCKTLKLRATPLLSGTTPWFPDPMPLLCFPLIILANSLNCMKKFLKQFVVFRLTAIRLCVYYKIELAGNQPEIFPKYLPEQPLYSVPYHGISCFSRNRDAQPMKSDPILTPK
jgi:hypothetical protein